MWIGILLTGFTPPHVYAYPKEILVNGFSMTYFVVYIRIQLFPVICLLFALLILMKLIRFSFHNIVQNSF